MLKPLIKALTTQLRISQPAAAAGAAAMVAATWRRPAGWPSHPQASFSDKNGSSKTADQKDHPDKREAGYANGKSRGQQEREAGSALGVGEHQKTQPPDGDKSLYSQEVRALSCAHWCFAGLPHACCYLALVATR